MPSTREQIVGVIRDVIAPLIRADGGLLYLVDAGDDSVTLHLAGRYAGCPGNTLARRRIIEPAIFAVAPGARVTMSSGPIIPDNAELLADAPPMRASGVTAMVEAPEDAKAGSA
jgi:Fe-S cluster biogenesis protein NfuA